MNAREAREAAFWLAWRRGLRDDPKRYLPGLLDDLDRIGAGDAGDQPDTVTPAAGQLAAPEDLEGGLQRKVRRSRNQPKG